MGRPRQDWTTLSPLLWLAGAILILYFARPVLVPLALALTLNFLLTPLVMRLQKLGLRRVPAVAMVVIVCILALSGLGWIVARQLVDVANDLPKYRQNIHEKLEALHLPMDSPLWRATASVQEIESEFSNAANTNKVSPKTSPDQPGRLSDSTRPLPVQVVPSPSNDVANLREIVSTALMPLGIAGMVLIFTIFILLKQEDLRDRFLRLAGVGQLHAMTLALDDAAGRISRYLVMQVLVNACYGLCFGIGLFFLGVPNAVLWGVIAALLRIVPYAGVLVATVFPFMMALAVFHSWGPPLLVIALFAVLELIASNFVEPWLYSAHTGISSLALLVTTVFWTMLWGWAGLVLAVPLTVCLIVLGRYVPRMSFLHILLGDERALSIEAQFYQRLLALDQEDARMIANNFLRSHSLNALYDQVLVPALALAEQDRHKGALDDTRESFVFLGTSEIISELAVWRSHETPNKPRRFISRLRSSARSQLSFDKDRVEPAASDVRIFCLAANDQADEIVSSMLAQLLERNGHGVLSLPANSAFEEILAHLSPEAQDVVCISALPPFAFAQASALCQRVRAQLPEIRILVGIWGPCGDLQQAKQRFGGTPPDAIVSSLVQAVEQIADWNNRTGETEKIKNQLGESEIRL